MGWELFLENLWKMNGWPTKDDNEIAFLSCPRTELQSDKIYEDVIKWTQNEPQGITILGAQQVVTKRPPNGHHFGKS